MQTLINYSKYLIKKKSQTGYYLQMRRDYVVNRNQDASICCAINSVLRPKYNISRSKGIIGDLNRQEVKNIVSSIKENGIYQFKNKVNDATVSAIKTFMETAPISYCSPEEYMVYKPTNEGYRKSMHLSNRFDLRNVETVNNSPEILQLITDQNFLHIANAYLNTRPILDSVGLWWNKTIPAELEQSQKDNLRSASAQMFHLDMDRLKFLKFFVYLTDVTEETGPHVYVKKTHRTSPLFLKADGRYSDEEIEKHAKEDIVTVCGPKGTIIAVDTRGLHKGKVLERDERLIFEVEFTNSLFGNPSVPKASLNLNPDNKFREVYSLYQANGVKS